MRTLSTLAVLGLSVVSANPLARSELKQITLSVQEAIQEGNLQLSAVRDNIGEEFNLQLASWNDEQERGIRKRAGAACATAMTAAATSFNSLFTGSGACASLDASSFSGIFGSSVTASNIETVRNGICLVNNCIQGLKKVVDDIMDKCLGEFASIIEAIPIVKVISVIPLLLSAVCVKDTAGSYCIDQLPTVFQNLGALEFSSGSTNAVQITTGLKTVCTECNIKLLNIMISILKVIGKTGSGANIAGTVGQLLGMVCMQSNQGNYCMAEWYSFSELILNDSKTALTDGEKVLVEKVLCQSDCIRKTITQFFAQVGNADMAASVTALVSDALCARNEKDDLCITLAADAVSEIMGITTDCSCTEGNECLTAVQKHLTTLGCCANALKPFILSTFASCNLLTFTSSCEVDSAVVEIAITLGASFDTSKMNMDVFKENLKKDVMSNFGVSGEMIELTITGKEIKITITANSGIAYLMPSSIDMVPSASNPSMAFAFTSAGPQLGLGCSESQLETCLSQSSVSYDNPNSPGSNIRSAFPFLSAFGMSAATCYMLN